MGKITIWMPVAWVFAICLAVLMLTGTAMGEISRTGLVAEWHFDRDATDSSGNGIDGIIYGATFVDGKFGKALSFNGVDNYVTAGRISQITNDSDWTVSFWMNSASVSSYRNLFDANFVAGANNQGPRFEQDSTGNLVVVVGTSPSNYIAPRIDSITTGIWYHVVGIKNGNTIKVYLNNIKKIDQSNDLWPPGFNNVNIGRGYSVSPERWYKGTVDEVLIYNRALTADEVKGIYEAGQIIITSSPSGAEVLVDGNSKGIASPTLSVYGVSPGIHTVKCKLSGYSDYDTNVVLTATSVASIPCSLTLITPTPSAPTPSAPTLSTPTPTLSTPTPTLSASTLSTPTPTLSTPTPTLSASTLSASTLSTPTPTLSASTLSASTLSTPIDKEVITALIGAFATIIAAYFGYRAIKKK